MLQTPDELGRLNSLTKYPSIPTYHVIGDRGRLTEEVLTSLPVDQMVSCTEKVDGTNARMVLLLDPDPSVAPDWFLGSREELLYARGDRIGDPDMGIVAALAPIAEDIARRAASQVAVPTLLVIYGEVYGGNVGPSKQYTETKAVGFRVFDMINMPMHAAEPLLRVPREHIARWRDHGGQTFLGLWDLERWCATLDLPIVPSVLELPGAEMPLTIDDTVTLLREQLPTTLVALDGGAGGKPEGLVARTADRRVICKIRYEDYERTLRAR